MTKPKARHKGEAIRLMSGEHGTALVEDGDLYPDWFTPPDDLAVVTETTDEESE